MSLPKRSASSRSEPWRVKQRQINLSEHCKCYFARVQFWTLVEVQEFRFWTYIDTVVNKKTPASWEGIFQLWALRSFCLNNLSTERCEFFRLWCRGVSRNTSNFERGVIQEWTDDRTPLGAYCCVRIKSTSQLKPVNWSQSTYRSRQLLRLLWFPSFSWVLNAGSKQKIYSQNLYSQIKSFLVDVYRFAEQ